MLVTHRHRRGGLPGRRGGRAVRTARPRRRASSRSAGAAALPSATSTALRSRALAATVRAHLPGTPDGSRRPGGRRRAGPRRARARRLAGLVRSIRRRRLTGWSRSPIRVVASRWSPPRFCSWSPGRLVVVVGGYPTFILPAPEVVAGRFVEAWAEGTMTPHVLATLTEIVLGLRGRRGVWPSSIGYLLARSRIAERLLSPYLVAAQAMPILVLAPLLVLWLGHGPSAEGRDLRADRLLPGRRGDDGRHPVGRRAAARARAQPARDALAGLPPSRAAGGDCRRSWVACASASRWR